MLKGKILPVENFIWYVCIQQSILYLAGMKNLPLTYLFFLVAAMPAFAQNALLNNMGALIYTAPGAIVKVQNGSMLHTQAGTFTNHGTTTIDSSFYNEALTQGNGNYLVGLHWVNDGVFIPDTSYVNLWGDNQFITGDSVTRFYKLELTGTGVKTQQIRSYTIKTLTLNDRELATDTAFMHVLNPDTGSIVRSSGFVSSIQNGKLYRNTNSTQAYWFPTGSSLGNTRYRPVRLRPQSTSAQTFGARLANVNATTEGYDLSLVDSAVCKTNPLFFHRINQTQGNAAALLQIYYLAAADSAWDGIAHWDDQPQIRWEDIPGTTQANALGMQFVEKNTWNDYNTSDAFVLDRVRPAKPVISGNDVVCGNQPLSYSALPDNPNYTYNWAPQPGSVQPGSGPNEAFITWDSLGGTGNLTLVITAGNGCSSYPTVMPVNISPAVTAAFDYTPNNTFGSVPITFDNQSVNNYTNTWTFGDGGASSVAEPTHVFNNQGTYEVMLVVTSEAGCSDTAWSEVTVVDGLVIPNVFTPDGDGINDYFEVFLTGFDQYKCEIFNRWGESVFVTETPSIQWDGRIKSGGLASNGVYFVAIHCTLKGKPFKYEGHVTVFHKN